MEEEEAKARGNAGNLYAMPFRQGSESTRSFRLFTQEAFPSQSAQSMDPSGV